MATPKVIYRDSTIPRDDSWGRYVSARIFKNNENWLCAMTGLAGVGKTYTALSKAIEWQKYGFSFSLDNMVFSFLDLMKLINYGNLKRGSIIIIEEPQTEINSKTWQSEINKCFFQLASTFRHRGYVVFFTNPFLHDLDKSVRKLFNAEWNVLGKDQNLMLAKVKPQALEWNSQKDDWYRHYLKVVYKPEGKSRYVKRKLKQIYVKHPPKSISEPYEELKLAFTTALNRKIQAKLEEIQRKEAPKHQEPNIKCSKCAYEWCTNTKLRRVKCPSCGHIVAVVNNMPANN